MKGRLGAKPSPRKPKFDLAKAKFRCLPHFRIGSIEIEFSINDATNIAITGANAVVLVADSDFIKIDGLHVINSPMQGIVAYISSNIVIQNCYTDLTWKSGIAVWGDKMLQEISQYVYVYDNEVSRANSWDAPGADLTARQPPHEAISFGRVEDFEIAGNVVHGGNKAGIDAKGPNHRGRIFNNTVYNLERVALYVDGWTSPMSDIEIFNNYVFDCRHGLQIASEDGPLVSNIRVHNNVFRNIDRIGLTIATTSEDGPRADIEFVNNTVDGADHAITVATANVDGVLVRNNLSYNIRYNPYVENANAKNVVADYNSWDQDPLWVDPVNGDYSLQDGSFAIDAGHPDAAYNDPDGTRSDLGAIYFDQSVSEELSVSVNGADVALDWPDYTGSALTNYRIVRNGAVIDWWETVSDYTDSALADGTYEYEVIAYDSNNKVELQSWFGTAVVANNNGDDNNNGEIGAVVEIDPWSQYDGFFFNLENTSSSASIDSVVLTVTGGGGFDSFGADSSFTVSPDPGSNGDSVRETSITVTFGNGLAAGSSVTTGDSGNYDLGDIDGKFEVVDVSVNFSDGTRLSASLSDIGDSDDGDARLFSATLGAENDSTEETVEEPIDSPSIYIEAEDADNASDASFIPWEVKTGTPDYIVWDDANTWAMTDAGANDAGLAQYTFILDSAADIDLRALVRFDNNGENSFFVRLVGHDDSWKLVTGATTTGFEWRNAHVWTAVPAGTYTIEVQTREANTEIDQLYITTDGTNP